MKKFFLRKSGLIIRQYKLKSLLNCWSTRKGCETKECLIKILWAVENYQIYDI